MSSKVTIREEIDNLKGRLKEISDTYPDYLNRETKELQTTTILQHTNLERGLEAILLIGIAEEEIKLNKNRNIRSVTPTSLEIIGNLSFIKKMEIIKRKDKVFPDTHIKKVNKYRVEFAHPDGVHLNSKYNYNNPKGLENVRNLLRALNVAKEKMDKYFIEKINPIYKKYKVD